MIHLKQFPCLMQYEPTNEYAGIVIWMREKRDGVVVYIPDGPLAVTKNVYLFDVHAPTAVELIPFTGKVVLRPNQDPTVEPLP